MSSFFALMYRQDCGREVPIPTAVKAELERHPHEASGQWSVPGVAALQTSRWFTRRDQVAIRPWHDTGPGGLVFAGSSRLDNHRELARELGLDQDADDAEVICAAYRAHGRMFADRLLGDFGFVLYDPCQHRLLMVRDPLGICPLYYHLDREQCLVSDNIDVVLAHPHVSPRLNDEVMAEWLLEERVFATTDTFFSDIRKCPRATVIEVGADDAEHFEYWNVSTVPSSWPGGEKQAAAHLRTLIEKVIADRVEATYPLASHSSGGLDCTPISILAGRLCRRQHQAFHTFNWCQSDDDDDPADRHEWADAQAVSLAEGFIHHEIGSDPADMAELLLHHDPARNGSTMFEYETRLLERARRAGIRQILTGFGGDEFLTEQGRDNLLPLLRSGRLLLVLRRLSLEAPSLQRFAHLRLMLNFARLILQALQSKERAIRQDLAKSRADRELRSSCLTPQMANKAAHRSLIDPHWLTEGVRQRQQLMLQSGYHQERIESWAALGRRAGVRYLYPYLDRRIVEFALALPPEFFYRHGQSRYLYKRSIKDFVPAFLLQKKKPSETERVRKYVLAYEAALGDPRIGQRLLRATSPYIDTRALQRKLGERDPTQAADWEGRIESTLMMVTALLSLNIGQRDRAASA